MQKKIIFSMPDAKINHHIIIIADSIKELHNDEIAAGMRVNLNDKISAERIVKIKLSGKIKEIV